MREGMYKIMKDIPFEGGRKFAAGTDLYFVNGVFYLDGGMPDQYFQEDFANLMRKEMREGWNYLRPVDVM